MKKIYWILAGVLLVLVGVTAGTPTAKGSPGNGKAGYWVWHQVGRQDGKWIVVDQPGCWVHITSHPDDYVSGYEPGDLEGCGYNPPT